jgi:hypothetical protein
MGRLLTVTAMAAVAMSACGDDDEASEDSVVTAEATGGVSADVPHVVGDEGDAATATLEAAGFTLRVVSRDGEDLPGTAAHVENRVNVAVETQEDGTDVVTEVVSQG